MTAGVAHSRTKLFSAVKYLTYALLLMNIFWFLREELGSLEHTFTGGLKLGDFIQVFAATIDTAAWVILLLLFELETYVLDDERIRGGVKLALHGIRGVCYIAVLYAFSGYCAELLTLHKVTPMAPGWDACSSLADDWSLLLRLDEYEPLSAQNCVSLADGAFQIEGFSIVGAPNVLQQSRYLAWVDAINSLAWIFVVIVLEVEVRLQLRGTLTDAVVRITSYIKFVLYGTLLAAAVYWGFRGSFLDFWDAALWLFAFIFIELNVFDWQRESQQETVAV